MNPPPSTQARESARQDVEDIRSLKNHMGFNRYYLRRLKQKRADTDKKFRKDPPNICDAVQREAYRQLLEVFDDLEKMMEVDEATALRQLND